MRESIEFKRRYDRKLTHVCALPLCPQCLHPGPPPLLHTMSHPERLRQILSYMHMHSTRKDHKYKEIQNKRLLHCTRKDHKCKAIPIKRYAFVHAHTHTITNTHTQSIFLELLFVLHTLASKKPIGFYSQDCIFIHMRHSIVRIQQSCQSCSTHQTRSRSDSSQRSRQTTYG